MMTKVDRFRFLAGWMALAMLMLGCAGAPATEAQEGGSGSRCERPDQCPEGEQCDQGGCIEPFPEEASCERDSQCRTGSCVATSEAGTKICD